MTCNPNKPEPVGDKYSSVDGWNAAIAQMVGIIEGDVRRYRAKGYHGLADYLQQYAAGCRSWKVPPWTT